MTRSLENTIRMGLISACKPDSISRFYRAPVETEFGYAYVTITGTDDPKGWTELLITSTEGISASQFTELLRCCVEVTKGIKTLIMIDGDKHMFDQLAQVVMPKGQNMFFSHLWKNPRNPNKGCRSFYSNDYRFGEHLIYKNYPDTARTKKETKMFSEKQISVIGQLMDYFPDREQFLSALAECMDIEW